MDELLVSEPVLWLVVELSVVVVSDPVDTVVEPVVTELVMDWVLVVFCMHHRSPRSGYASRQDVSHMCAAWHVGQKAMKHKSIMSLQPGRQSL